jgi:hypothetical protein
VLSLGGTVDGGEVNGYDQEYDIQASLRRVDHETLPWANLATSDLVCHNLR